MSTCFDARARSCPGVAFRLFRYCSSADLTVLLAHSERDTTGQLIGPIDEVITVVTELVSGAIEWQQACERLPAYDGVQAVE